LEKKEVEFIRDVAKDTVFEVLDEEVLEPLTDLLNAFEAAITQFKQAVSKRVGVAIKEEAFHILKWEKASGSRLGEFEVAYKNSNLPDKWDHAYAVLRRNNATISNRYHGDGYVYAYWIYGEGKIYRQKLKK